MDKINTTINVADVISAAAQSTLGVLSLLVLVIAAIAYAFFRQASEFARGLVFSAILLSGLGFGAALLQTMRDATGETKLPPVIQIENGSPLSTPGNDSLSKNTTTKNNSSINLTTFNNKSGLPPKKDIQDSSLELRKIKVTMKINLGPDNYCNSDINDTTQCAPITNVFTVNALIDGIDSQKSGMFMTPGPHDIQIRGVSLDSCCELKGYCKFSINVGSDESSTEHYVKLRIELTGVGTDAFFIYSITGCSRDIRQISGT